MGGISHITGQKTGMHFWRHLLTGLVALFAVAVRAEEAAVPTGWLNVHDYDEVRAFEDMGPPTRANAKAAMEETDLYRDMLAHFEDIADDEDDFAFVAEAFSVSLEELRPASLRVIDEGVDDVFADDPLPGKVQSTSVYVNKIRLTTLPGLALKPRNLDDVKLGDIPRHSLFGEEAKPKAPAPPKAEAVAEKKEEKPPLAQTPGASAPPAAHADTSVQNPAAAVTPLATAAEAPAGQINKPQAATPSKYVSPDEETLVLLRQAVKELGLEKQLNFEASQYSNQTMLQMQEQKAGKKDQRMEGPAMPVVQEKQDSMKEAAQQAPVTPQATASPPSPVVATPIAGNAPLPSVVPAEGVREDVKKEMPVSKPKKKRRRVAPISPPAEPPKVEEDDSWF